MAEFTAPPAPSTHDLDQSAELFAALGFEELVDPARAGAARAEVGTSVPIELPAQIGALGSAREISARVAAYHEAGADHVAVVPSPAEDPASQRVLESLSTQPAVRA